MKTTVEIPEMVYRRIKASAALQGKTIEDFLVEAVRDKLAAAAAEPKRKTGWRSVYGAVDLKEVAELQPLTRSSPGAKGCQSPHDAGNASSPPRPQRQGVGREDAGGAGEHRRGHLFADEEEVHRQRGGELQIRQHAGDADRQLSRGLDPHQVTHQRYDQAQVGDQQPIAKGE
jgi:hypothetical protein